MKFKMLKKLIASALVVVSVFVVFPHKIVRSIDITASRIEQTMKTEKNVVYISPSTQYDNSYVNVNGIKTTEGKTMQEIGNLVKDNLVKRGVVVYMNNPQENFNSHVIRGNKLPGVDCYVALHSNAAGEKYKGQAQGILVITRKDAESQKLSSMMYKHLQKVYPYKEKSRGIIFNGKYREVSGPNAPTLIAEIGFHDNYKDAEFLLNNKQKIADAVADAIYEYLKS